MDKLVAAALTFSLAALLVLVALGIWPPWAVSDHTHEPTGIQDGVEVCVAGNGAVDYDINTSRPFIVCGMITLESDGEVAPPLGSDTHLAQ